MRGMVHHWLNSDVHNRKQHLQLADVQPELARDECGVPHGSVLGPQTFVFVNDICDFSELFQCVLFADYYSNFSCSGNNVKEPAECVIDEMTKLKIQFDVNMLSLNIKKTKFIKRKYIIILCCP